MPERTVRAVLARNGLARLPRPDADEPANRYERPAPGELIHIDVKKLGRIGRAGHRVNGDRRTRSRGIGWEFVHVAVDDCTRLAYVEVLDDERTDSVIGFVRRAVAFFNAHGIEVQRLMTDNGPAYRSHAHSAVCRQLAIRHLFTQPYRPKTNGKAERFIRTLLAEWAYGAAYPNSQARTRALPGFLTRYNHHRPHKALSGSPPAERLAERLNATAASASGAVRWFGGLCRVLDGAFRRRRAIEDRVLQTPVHWAAANHAGGRAASRMPGDARAATLGRNVRGAPSSAPPFPVRPFQSLACRERRARPRRLRRRRSRGATEDRRVVLRRRPREDRAVPDRDRAAARGPGPVAEARERDRLRPIFPPVTRQLRLLVARVLARPALDRVDTGNQ